jgi:hypothetical protein
MKKYLFLMITFLSFSSNTVYAGLMFGKKDSIIAIQNINQKDQNSDNLFLGHRITTNFFILGVSVSDQGYVLGVKEKYNRYYPLDEQKIAELQKKNILPTPLPRYKIDLFQYLVGYSLYIFIVVIGLWDFSKRKFKNRLNSHKN